MVGVRQLYPGRRVAVVSSHLYFIYDSCIATILK